MLSAMAGSMMRAGRIDDLQRGERQRDAVAERERGHDRQQPREAAAEQQQADDEEDVIGPDGDVMDAGRRERREDGQQSLPRAGEEVDARAVAAQDLLPHQHVAFVDVDERLVRGVVREEVRADRQLAGGPARRRPPEDLDGVLAFDRPGRDERPRDRPGRP